MTETIKHTSKCKCGEVELELEGNPTFNVHCHCTMCQQWSGSPFQWLVLFAWDKVKVVKGQDNLTMITASENMERARCKSCTSHIYNRLKVLQMYGIPGVAIQGIRNEEDHTIAEDFAPRAAIFYSTRVQDMNAGLPIFDGAPPSS